VIHPTLAIEMARVRQSELQKEVEAYRLPKEIKAGHDRVGQEKNS